MAYLPTFGWFMANVGKIYHTWIPMGLYINIIEHKFSIVVFYMFFTAWRNPVCISLGFLYIMSRARLAKLPKLLFHQNMAYPLVFLIHPFHPYKWPYKILWMDSFQVFCSNLDVKDCLFSENVQQNWETTGHLNVWVNSNTWVTLCN